VSNSYTEANSAAATLPVKCAALPCSLKPKNSTMPNLLVTGYVPNGVPHRGLRLLQNEVARTLLIKEQTPKSAHTKHSVARARIGAQAHPTSKATRQQEFKDHIPLFPFASNSTRSQCSTMPCTPPPPPLRAPCSPGSSTSTSPIAGAAAIGRAR
jgi:hypothetical protein